jgi:hypothetical protein
LYNFVRGSFFERLVMLSSFRAKRIRDLTPGEHEKASAVESPATLPPRTRITPFGKGLMLGCAVSLVTWAGIGWLLARYLSQ